MVGLPKSRADAREAGSEFYFTGKPCKRGHVTVRDTKKGCCKTCRKEDWQKENDRRKALPKSEASKAAGRRYYERNTELVKARAAARSNEDKQRYRNTWKANNKSK